MRISFNNDNDNIIGVYQLYNDNIIGLYVCILIVYNVIGDINPTSSLVGPSLETHIIQSSMIPTVIIVDYTDDDITDDITTTGTFINYCDNRGDYSLFFPPSLSPTLSLSPSLTGAITRGEVIGVTMATAIIVLLVVILAVITTYCSLRHKNKSYNISNGYPATYHGNTPTANGYPATYHGNTPTANGYPATYHGNTTTSNGYPATYHSNTLSSPPPYPITQLTNGNTTYSTDHIHLHGNGLVHYSVVGNGNHLSNSVSDCSYDVIPPPLPPARNSTTELILPYADSNSKTDPNSYVTTDDKTQGQSPHRIETANPLYASTDNLEPVYTKITDMEPGPPPPHQS